MAGPRDKRKAEASRSGGAPDQPKKRRKIAPPTIRLGVDAGSFGCVHTKELEMFDVAHKLRSGMVMVLNTTERGPLQFRKGEKPVYDMSWKIPACVDVALEHYNRLNEDVHELVKAVDGYAFLYNGEWVHANFLAKSKQGVTKTFFAELKIEGRKKIKCATCTEMVPVDRKTAPVRGVCTICPSRIFHPAAGEHLGAKSGVRRVGAYGEAASLFKLDAEAVAAYGETASRSKVDTEAVAAYGGTASRFKVDAEAIAAYGETASRFKVDAEAVAAYGETASRFTVDAEAVA